MLRMTASRLASRVKLVIIMAIALVAAWQIAIHATVRFLAPTDPAKALDIRPNDGTALVWWVNKKTEANPGYVPGPAQAKAASASLRSRPLNEGALRIIGSECEARGDKKCAARAMKLADRVARRDVLNQLWLIEYAVDRNDVKSAVAHYHNALSIRPELANMLYPVLSAAITFPEVRAAIIPYIRMHAVWIPPFFRAVAPTADPLALAALMRPVAADLSGSDYIQPNAKVIHRLANAGKPETARALWLRLLPDVDPAIMGDMAISEASSDPRLGDLGWSFPQIDGINSAVESSGILTASIAPLSRGIVAQRDIAVSSGRNYRLSHRLRQDESGARAELRWTATCVYPVGLTNIWSESLPNTGDVSYGGTTISVPKGCHVLRFALIARGPEGQIGANISVSTIRLSPL